MKRKVRVILRPAVKTVVKNRIGFLQKTQRGQNSSLFYLQVPLWVLFFTVFTFYDPPFARVCHVLFEIFSFHRHMAIFAGTSNDFEWTSFQVSLFETITNFEN